MPYQRLAAVILEEWQVVHDHLALAETDSAEAALFRAAAEVLRDEYQHLVDEALSHGRSLPPPFPEV